MHQSLLSQALLLHADMGNSEVGHNALGKTPHLRCHAGEQLALGTVAGLLCKLQGEVSMSAQQLCCMKNPPHQAA